MAWVNATPDKPESKTPAPKDEAPALSRREALKKRGIPEPEMPPCQADYLIAYLFEIGPSTANGMGESPINQSEIAHFQSNTGIELSAWEARNLRRLSSEYISASYNAKKPDCPSPWVDASYANLPALQKAESARNAIRALANL